MAAASPFSGNGHTAGPQMKPVPPHQPRSCLRHLPWPIGAVTNVDVGSFRDIQIPQEREENRILTSDQNVVNLGYTGYIAHEYRPTPGKDPIEVLKRVLDLMDV